MANNDHYNHTINELDLLLRKYIFEQDIAIEIICKSLLESHLIKQKSNLPNLFTFIGPANSGKHYLSELFAKHFSYKLKTFYMDQYSGSFEYGSTQLGAVGFSNDLLTYMSANPNSIIVFEDIEKADLQVQLALYTLLSDYEKDGIDFSNAIIILTTTSLSTLLQRKDVKKLIQENPQEAHTFLMDRLSHEQIVIGDSVENAFDRKLLSLLAEYTTVPFNRLSINALIKIGADSFKQMEDQFIKNTEVEIEHEDFNSFNALLTLSLAPYLNARHIKQKLPKQIFDQLYSVLKEEDDIEKISYKISSKAKEYLKELLSDENELVKKTTQQHKRVNIDWKIIANEKKIECIINDAYYSDEELSVSSDDALHLSEITFDDIAGQKKVKRQLLEIVSLLKEPNRLEHFNLSMPKGMILYGPSGMGKKLLARAFAHEANMPFVVLSGSELFERKNILKAYSSAYGSAPAIVIFEDIDIQGILNGMVTTMSVEPIVEQLDNLHQSLESPIFTIITITSRSSIPPELVQANRINIQIEVPKLDIEAREFFVKEILKKPHDETIDLARIVRYISGMGGNELKRIGDEASLYAARKGLKELTEEILLEQINIIKYGTKLENKQIRDVETSMAKTAYHEAGHAVVSYVLLPHNKIEQVTVAPRSESLGFTSYHNDDFIDSISKEELFNDICVLLAGRIAKMEKFGDEGGMETGAINDLEVATMQIYAAIALFGMDEKLGYLNLTGLSSVHPNLFKEDMEERISVWIDEATKKTKAEVKRLWPAIDQVAKTLIEKEVIDGEELKSIVDKEIQ